MVDHLRFTRELIALRKRQPALRGDAINVFHVHNINRVIAFHRWAAGGQDVVVVASLREQTWYGYRIGLPRPGRWIEFSTATSTRIGSTPSLRAMAMG